ncbi:MAG: UDP-N-acetylmuramoyl-tripeptide--D-alanyl-D-alanine ligase [Rikenellaceae bacterium]|nr:UDP-N-acetylmuramoyl-tripeptide--D-alanyl-D-alanine ligase [Rikenellaceae bacterium]
MYSSEKLLHIYDIFLQTGKISTDTRKIESGSLFFALRGGNFDGNKFAHNAVEAGASACVIDDPQEAVSDKFILVNNVLETLQELAAYHRRQLGVPVLAITGTNGKTTTKELLSNVLSLKYRLTVTQGNLNNHIGVPLTLLSMNRDTEFAVVEMGTNHRGEIKLLCGIAQPDYGIITNIGKAHLEGFGSTEGIIATKGELFDYLDKHNGTAFYASDDPNLRAMTADRPNLKNISFTAGQYDIANGPNGNLVMKNGDMELNTRMVGMYNASNIAAAICVGTYFGIPADRAASAVAEYIPENGRSQKKDTGKNILILDYYNANPTSMAASIENFKSIDAGGKDKTVIIGDMFELGKYLEEEHMRIIDKLSVINFKTVILVGKIFSTINYNPEFRTFGDTGELSEYLRTKPVINNLILLKGSRGIALEKIENLL